MRHTLSMLRIAVITAMLPSITGAQVIAITGGRMRWSTMRAARSSVRAIFTRRHRR